MRVVIDTNILLISMPTKSRYRPIFDGLLQKKFELAINNEILSEYIVKIEEKANEVVATNIGELMVNSRNVIKTEVYFKWNLIHVDFDDNKFVDCAIASNSNYIVTNDKHFNPIKEIDFPPVEIINGEEFLDLVKDMK